MMTSMVTALNGSIVRHQFSNGFGVSIARHEGAYCDLREGDDAPEQTFEVAVLAYNDEDGSWSLTYDTPITGDVLGWQTAEEVDAVMAAVEAL